MFNEDGSYMQCGDRVPVIHGRYGVQQERVCATLGIYMTCWQLFQGPAQAYFVRGVSPTLTPLERVCVRPWAERTEPCV